MTYYNRQMRRNERQRLLNNDLSVLPVFTSVNEYQIYHINHSTSPMLVHDLIELARNTTRFTIDTEHDYYTHRPALIQIEYVRKANSVVLLIETCHLPHSSSVLFWLIQSLVKVIFKSSNVIYSWGDVICELTNLIQYNLFSLHVINEINNIDIQYQFKQWYNKIFVHSCGLLLFADDSLLCTCPHRPVKDRNNKWSLQKAIAYTFNEFLDKSRTKSNWGRRLDSTKVPPFSIIRKQENKEGFERLIQYAASDCLAVTKLVSVLNLNPTK